MNVMEMEKMQTTKQHNLKRLESRLRIDALTYPSDGGSAGPWRQPGDTPRVRLCPNSEYDCP
jgi:hypothetical protein